jgi:hypothetical protein
MLREYNRECYAHVRVYNEVLVENDIPFGPFRTKFGNIVGTFVLQQLASERMGSPPAPSSSFSSTSSFSRTQSPTSYPPDALSNRVRDALRATDDVATFLRNRGYVSSWERSVPTDDDIEDFADTTTYAPVDLTYSLALNGDVTLDSQLLLQELGYRLYPSIGQWTTAVAISKCFSGKGGAAGSGGGDDDSAIGGGDGKSAGVQIDDYYMDTRYNSNPDLFEAKQVLLNIVIQRE